MAIGEVIARLIAAGPAGAVAAGALAAGAAAGGAAGCVGAAAGAAQAASRIPSHTSAGPQDLPNCMGLSVIRLVGRPGRRPSTRLQDTAGGRGCQRGLTR